MKLTIPQHFNHIFLFFIAVVFSFSSNFELQFGVWLLIFGYYILGKYSIKFLIFVGCYLAISLLGLYRAFLYDYTFHSIARDLSYFLKPVLGFVIGYQIFKRNNINLLKVIIYISFILAISHLLIISYHGMFYGIRSVNGIRSVGGFFSDFEVYALILLMFSNKLGIHLKRKEKITFLVIISISVILYFARTNIIQFIILSMGMLGFFKPNIKNIVILLGFILLGSIGYYSISQMNPRRDVKGIESFLYKIKNAPSEIYDPYVQNDNSKRFHDRFRSYETKVTILQVTNKKDASVWLGSGFGSTVNYGTIINTTDGSQVQFAPILHNGYTTVFLKVGILGLLIFGISLLYLCFFGKFRNDVETESLRTLINSTGVFMFLSTLVFLGFYLKLDNKSLIVGALIAYYERINMTNINTELPEKKIN